MPSSLSSGSSVRTGRAQAATDNIAAGSEGTGPGPGVRVWEGGYESTRYGGLGRITENMKSDPTAPNPGKPERLLLSHSLSCTNLPPFSQNLPRPGPAMCSVYEVGAQGHSPGRPGLGAPRPGTAPPPSSRAVSRASLVTESPASLTPNRQGPTDSMPLQVTPGPCSLRE